MYTWYKPAITPTTGVHDVMARFTTSVKGFLTDFPTNLTPNIVGDEDLINLSQLLGSNTASVASNPGGNCFGRLTLKMALDNYLAHMAHAFVPPHNPGDYPPTLSTA